mmetsp:Transcript_90970/g.278478  ORF Transcript_90970/g.278478 Transcript_90970/m.278478 type:complete len:656 (+) Transcript_90970:1685-3652(+)
MDGQDGRRWVPPRPGHVHIRHRPLRQAEGPGESGRVVREDGQRRRQARCQDIHDHDEGVHQKGRHRLRKRLVELDVRRGPAARRPILQPRPRGLRVSRRHRCSGGVVREGREPRREAHGADLRPHGRKLRQHAPDRVHRQADPRGERHEVDPGNGGRGLQTERGRARGARAGQGGGRGPRRHRGDAREDARQRAGAIAGREAEDPRRRPGALREDAGPRGIGAVDRLVQHGRSEAAGQEDVPGQKTLREKTHHEEDFQDRFEEADRQHAVQAVAACEHRRRLGFGAELDSGDGARRREGRAEGVQPRPRDFRRGERPHIAARVRGRRDEKHGGFRRDPGPVLLPPHHPQLRRGRRRRGRGVVVRAYAQGQPAAGTEASHVGCVRHESCRDQKNGQKGQHHRLVRARRSSCWDAQAEEDAVRPDHPQQRRSRRSRDCRAIRQTRGRARHPSDEKHVHDRRRGVPQGGPALQPPLVAAAPALQGFAARLAQHVRVVEGFRPPEYHHERRDIRRRGFGHHRRVDAAAEPLPGARPGPAARGVRRRVRRARQADGGRHLVGQDDRCRSLPEPRRLSRARAVQRPGRAHGRREAVDRATEAERRRDRRKVPPHRRPVPRHGGRRAGRVGWDRGHASRRVRVRLGGAFDGDQRLEQSRQGR